MKYFEPQKDKRKKYRSIVKHNHLVLSKYYLTGIEQKFLYKIFEEIQANGYKDNKVEILKGKFFNDFKKVIGKNITNKELNSILEALCDKPLELLDEDDNYVRTHWYSLTRSEDLTYISIKITSEVFSYIQSLETSFTKLRLETIYAFKSFHTMRVYELVKQWCNEKGGESEIAYSIDTFKDLTGLNIREEKINGVKKEINKGYKNYNNLKSKVLIPSIEEINQKSEIIVSFEEDRKTPKGKVHGLIFKVRMKDDAIEVKNSKVLGDSDDSNDINSSNNDNSNDSNDVNSNNNDNVNDNNKDDINNKYFPIPPNFTLSSEVEDLFRMDFGRINFNDDGSLRRLLVEAQHATLKKDNASEINVNNYGYFQSVLRHKIIKKKDSLIEAKLLKIMNDSEIDNYQKFFSDKPFKEYIQLMDYEPYNRVVDEVNALIPLFVPLLD